MSVTANNSQNTEYRILVKLGDEELARQDAVKAAISAEAARVSAIAAGIAEQVAIQKAAQTVEDAASALASKQEAESAASASGGFATDSGISATASQAARVLSEEAKAIAIEEAGKSFVSAGQSDASAGASEAAKNLSVSAKDTAIAKAAEANSSSITATTQAGISTAKAVESAQSAAQSLASKNQAAAILANTLTGGAVSGQVPFWNGPKNLIGDAGFRWNNATKQLSIIGDTFPMITITRTSDNFSGINFTAGTEAKSMVFGYRKFEDALLTLNNLNVFAGFSVLQNGNVGIATTTPTTELEVNGRIRVRLIDNAIGPFATYSATGVFQQRTRLEAATDILTSLLSYNAAIFQTLTHNSSGVIAWT